MWQPYAATTAALVVVAFLGSQATEIGPWFRALKKPSWHPPDWAFGVVWTSIYVLIIWSIGRVWPLLPAGQGSTLIILLGINLLLNVAWSYLFFTARRPVWSLIEVVPLWLSIVILLVFVSRFDALSGWLLAPYAIWVGIAAYLNLTMVRLNPDAHLLVAEAPESA